MKTLNILTSTFILAGFSLTHAQAAEFAALAIDKNNGFYYGWSYNHPSSIVAEKYAQDECTKKNGKSCTVVLSWSGNGCGVYRTVEGNVGTSYGWGIAITQAEADKIAIQNVLKRSNGKVASNYVWACNSNDKNKLKIIKNDDSSVKTVKIGSQVWMAENLSVSHFRNGDIIPLAKSDNEWVTLAKERKPLSRIFEDNSNKEKQYGRHYNWYAANDPRGICPIGFHVPKSGEWKILSKTLGNNPNVVATKLKSKTEWSGTDIHNGTDDYGFNALPTGHIYYWDGELRGTKYSAKFGTSSSYNSSYIDIAHLGGDLKIGAMGKYTEGYSIRCIKD